MPSTVSDWGWLATGVSGIIVALITLLSRRGAGKVRAEIASGDRAQDATRYVQVAQQAFNQQLINRIEHLESQLAQRDAAESALRDEIESWRQRMVLLGEEVDICNRERRKLQDRVAYVERELAEMKTEIIGYRSH